MDGHKFDFEKIVSGLKIDDQPRGNHKKKLRWEMLRTFNASKETPGKDGFPKIGRFIMQSRFMKFAAAAVIIIGVVFGMQFFGHAGGVVWADVVGQIKSVKTMSYISTEEAKVAGGAMDSFEVTSKSHVYVKDSGLFRTEIINIRGTLPNGGASSKSISEVFITRRTEKQVVRISYDMADGQRVFHRWTGNVLSPGGGIDNQAMRIWRQIKKLTSEDIRKEGMEEIKGVETVIFKASLKEVYPEIPFEGEAKVWVDSKTAVPVRVQAQFEDETGATKRLTFDGIQWDIPLSEALFREPEGWEKVFDQESNTVRFAHTRLRDDVKVAIGPKNGEAFMGEADIESVTDGTITVTRRKDEVVQEIRLTIVPTDVGREKISSYTAAHVGEKMLIDFDGRFRYEPKIIHPLSGQRFMIAFSSADMTLEEFEAQYLE